MNQGATDGFCCQALSRLTNEVAKSSPDCQNELTAVESRFIFDCIEKNPDSDLKRYEERYHQDFLQRREVVNDT